MPTKEIQVEKVTAKERSGKKGSFTSYGIKDQDGDWFNTASFRNDAGKLAQEHEGDGTVFKVTYEETEYGNDVTELALLKLGEGPTTKPQVTKAKENPETQRSIAAAVALREAVQTFQHTIKPDMTPRDAAEKIEPLAASYFNFLLRKAQVLADEDIPF